MSLLTPAPCGSCCANLHAYIEAHLDPGANLRPDDDAAEIVASLDHVFRAEGGSRISIEQMEEYLESLRARYPAP